MCSTADQRDATAQQQPGQRRMSAHAKGGCSWYANRGRCCRRERCYPRVIASEYLVKSNNAIDARMHQCLCTKKYAKFLDLALDLEKMCKCRWSNSISGHSCVRNKSKQARRKTCARIRLSQDTIANLWNVQGVSERSYCVKSQDNDLSESFAKKNVGRFQEESANVEKLVQEETTSSSYVDAKNCFVQDACIQTICENREETCSDRCEKEYKEITELSEDLPFVFYDQNETKVEDKFEQTSLNCDCDLLIVEERTKSVNVETSASLEQGDKLNETRSFSNSCTCVPHIPELQLEKECDCRPVFNYKHQYVEQCIRENEVESRQKCDQEIIKNKYRENRLYDARNLWNSEITSPSSCESNRYPSNNLRSSTSTESTIYPREKTKITRLDRDRRTSPFFEKSGRIGEGPWRRNEERISKNLTSVLNRQINTKEHYSNRDHNNRFTCRCGDMGQAEISDDKLEDTETSRSRTSSSSSTSLSSYDRDRSPRSLSRHIDCRCRNLASVASSASTCIGNLASEIECKRFKESSKTLNPLSLTSAITSGNNRNGRFNVTRLSCQGTLSVMQRRWKENRERTMNRLYY